VDVRQLLTGKDGQVFISSRNGVNIFLAEVDDFQARLNFKNVDYQPVGSYLEYGVPTGYSINVTMTEAVIRDDVMLEEVIDDIQNGWTPTFSIVGKLRRRDGQAQRIVYRWCLPDGELDLQNLKPGEIIKRSWSFRCNASPEMIEMFKGISGLKSDMYG
jgi:hypothetical protein